jgi:hypothetical protein
VADPALGHVHQPPGHAGDVHQGARQQEERDGQQDEAADPRLEGRGRHGEGHFRGDEEIEHAAHREHEGDGHGREERDGDHGQDRQEGIHVDAAGQVELPEAGDQPRDRSRRRQPERDAAAAELPQLLDRVDHHEEQAEAEPDPHEAVTDAQHGQELMHLRDEKGREDGQRDATDRDQHPEAHRAEALARARAQQLHHRHVGHAVAAPVVRRGARKGDHRESDGGRVRGPGDAGVQRVAPDGVEEGEEERGDDGGHDEDLGRQRDVPEQRRACPLGFPPAVALHGGGRPAGEGLDIRR